LSKAPSRRTGTSQPVSIIGGYELLGRYLGLFRDKVDITTDDKLIDQLMRGRRRAGHCAHPAWFSSRICD